MENKQLHKLIGIPQFVSIAELAELIHISETKLYAIARNSRPFYRRFEKIKKSGGVRQIYEPNKEVKAIQAWILKKIIYKLNPSMYATAYRKDFSIIDNVRYHQKQKYFLCLDIKEFFPSITIKNIKYFFMSIGYDKYIADMLARLCTCDNKLPQGGVTSPALSNFVCYKLDKRVSGFAGKKRIVYTRYADDITLSSNNRNVLNYSKNIVIAIIKNEDFEINENKTRFLGPGLVKNSSEPKFSIGKKKKNHMRSVFFNFLVNNRKIDDKYESIFSAYGWLAFSKNVDEKSFNYLSRYIKNIKSKQKVLEI